MINNLLTRIKVFTTLLLLAVSFHGISQKTAIVGDWYGVGDFGDSKLSIVFHIRDRNGSLIATMDSPDQFTRGIKVDSVLFENGNLFLKINTIALVYQGQLINNNKIDGRVKQGSVVDIAVELEKKATQESEVSRPQQPQPPFDYRIEEVTFESAEEDFNLSGTLTLPDSGAIQSSVILISGSGPQDRNETILGHQPFWVIADFLTKNQIAVLRFDDRGTGKSKGNYNDANSFDFANDVQGALNYLESRPEIDPNKIGLIGHSEGGLIAPIVAASNRNLQFIILLAGLGTSGRQLILDQTQYIAEASGIPKAFVIKTQSDLTTIMNIVSKAKTLEKSEIALRELVNRELDLFPPEQLKAMGGRESRIKLTLDKYNNRWMRDFIKFQPHKYLKKVKCPVLALNGTLDLQVPFESNLEAIEKALIAGKNKHYTLMPMQGLNHLFQHARKGTPDEYGKIAETIAPEVLDTLLRWINGLNNPQLPSEN